MVFATIVGIPEHEREVKVTNMIQDCQLLGKEDTRAGELTPGLLRRLTLGMALIGQPKIVILSNPLEGVDPQSKRKLIETIIKYTEGRALLLSTQSADVAERIGDRVGIMEEGKLESIGTVKEILTSNGFTYTVMIQSDV